MMYPYKWYFNACICYFTWIFRGYITHSDVIHIAKIYSGGLKKFVEMLDNGNVLVKYGRWYAVMCGNIPIAISTNYLDALEYLQPKLLHIHNVSRNELYSNGVPYIVTLHDYHFLCPRTFAYCLWEGKDACHDCRCNHEYRELMIKFLNKARCIIAPDNSVRHIYNKQDPILNIMVIPHA